ncbi:hypothetical protein Tco_1032034 [Tanacetum coccineum]|uniref:Uncharacterized protein n=1 Tax=Tanacetum coccineum TaxID=301880 RepID=A0ABQ5GAQ2_9ASTR
MVKLQQSSKQGAALLTEDLDTYDSDCDDISNAKACRMANNSNYGNARILNKYKLWILQIRRYIVMSNNIPIPNILQENPTEKSRYSFAAQQDSKRDIKERVKKRFKTNGLNIDLSSREKMIDSQMDDMIKEKLALKEQVDSLEQNISKQIKENECLLQTFTVFKSESKEKEDRYMENEIDLEKKINELDNNSF